VEPMSGTLSGSRPPACRCSDEWLNIMPHPTLSTGQCDDTGACTHSGSYMDAMTNAKKTVRMTSREETPAREVHRFFEKGPDGKEFKSMELIYTRR
jgi:hypothetical protein